MNCITKLVLISSAALLACCGTKTEAAPKPTVPGASGMTPPANNIPKAPQETPVAVPTTTPVADLGKVLSSITDGPTAQAAKGKLEAAIASLKSAAGAAGTDLTKLAGSAAASAGVDVTSLKAAALKQVESLLSNAAVKTAIGPTLEQLVPLLK